MTENTKEKKLICGIVMPISTIDGCNESHWSDVLDILSEAIEDAGFEPNLVSNSDDVGVIQKRIIQNLYDNPIVVCDVSAKNPNVMFELGLRLAFDKPTIIVKDDKTSYSFDTSNIEHLDYPRDLRFTKIVEFKQKLSDKISATHKRATSDSGYTTFLKHFGEFTVPKLDQKEISGQEYIIDELRNIRMMFNNLDRKNQISNRASIINERYDLEFCFNKHSQDTLNQIKDMINTSSIIANLRIDQRSDGHSHILINFMPSTSTSDINDIERKLKGLGGRKRRIVKSN